MWTFVHDDDLVGPSFISLVNQYFPQVPQAKWL